MVFYLISAFLGKLQSAFADFSGQGVYGKNVMANGGMTLQREDTDGQVCAVLKRAQLLVQLFINAKCSGIDDQVLFTAATKRLLLPRSSQSLPTARSWLVSK